MTVLTHERLIAGYVLHAQAVAHETKDSSSWAYEGLHGVAEQNPEAAWPAVLEVLARLPDDACLAYVAADVLEDLLCAHGELLIDRLEAQAVSDERFRQALSHVWGWNRMVPAVRQRLDRLVGTAQARTP